MSDAERIHRELSGIVAALSKITGLPTHWSGRVELVEEAAFKGQKPFQCDILLNANLVDEGVRWRTLIHEALHSFSAGYQREDFEKFRGWEEGVVEKLQRLLRQKVLSLLAVTVPESVFLVFDRSHLYNTYLDALAELQVFSGQSEHQFYLDLLGIPIREHSASVYSLVRQLTGQDRTDFLFCYSRANSTLKGEIRWNSQPSSSSNGNGSSV